MDVPKVVAEFFVQGGNNPIQMIACVARHFGDAFKLFVVYRADNVQCALCPCHRNVQQAHFFFALFVFVVQIASGKAQARRNRHGVVVVVFFGDSQSGIAFHGVVVEVEFGVCSGNYNHGEF